MSNEKLISLSKPIDFWYLYVLTTNKEKIHLKTNVVNEHKHYNMYFILRTLYSNISVSQDDGIYRFDKFPLVLSYLPILQI